MSKLQERLDRMKAGFLKSAPIEIKTVMNRATEELRGSGIMDRLPRAGTRLAPFTLPDTEGRSVSSEDLLAKGPLILTFYRGLW